MIGRDTLSLTSGSRDEYSCNGSEQRDEGCKWRAVRGRLKLKAKGEGKKLKTEEKQKAKENAILDHP